VVVDRIFYGRWVVVQWEFLKFNLLHGISAQYGTHPWHWYVTQGLPVVLGTGIPLLLHGIWLTFKTQPRINLIPLLLACWLTIVHSFIAHKEFRFVFPVLQLTMMYNGLSISYLLLMKNKAVKMMVYLLLLSNIPIAMYFSLIHQRGGYAVMEYLRKVIIYFNDII
jgi:phosphatidylinositol glycan class B